LKLALWSAAVLISLMVGASRIHLGSHWLTDVLGGYALGTFWGAFVVIAMLTASARGALSHDLHTTVQGVQVCITLFLLVMAALMIPCGKLTDRWGRKRCFTLGLSIYGVAAVLSAVAPGLGVLILGNSILEGVGTALLIPPVYILTTMMFTDMKSRARAFGVVSGCLHVPTSWSALPRYGAPEDTLAVHPEFHVQHPPRRRRLLPARWRLLPALLCSCPGIGSCPGAFTPAG
jgi:hypothetical protein